MAQLVKVAGGRARARWRIGAGDTDVRAMRQSAGRHIRNEFRKIW
jgi:hypothetical protein